MIRTSPGRRPSRAWTADGVVQRHQHEPDDLHDPLDDPEAFPSAGGKVFTLTGKGRNGENENEQGGE